MDGFSIGRDRASARRPRVESAADVLRRELKGFGEVLEPHEAEEPVLAPGARGAVFEWLAELRAGDELSAVGLKPRSTALLSGPPGCGKTTLAHHLAARLGIPMVSIGAESIFAKYLGESEQKIEALFTALRASDTPCLVFLDEIEAIGGSRSKNTGGGADNARGSILTVLLRHIEQFTGLLIGATNRPEDLDTALWRRFHLQVTVDLPGDDERFAIMRRYGLPFSFTDDDLDVLCGVTGGASPALLRGLMEGVKRALVIGARIGLDLSDPVRIFDRVVNAVRPPPEIDPPPLWQPQGARYVSTITWPPKREGSEG